MENMKGHFHLHKKYCPVGEVWVSGELNLSKPDAVDLIAIAECFAKEGSRVRVLAPIHYKSRDYKEVFSSLMGTKYERKCPDLWVDGTFYEYESYVRPWHKRKLSNMLTNGLKQSDCVIIDNREGTSVRQIKRAIRSRLNVNAKISEVWVYDGKEVICIYP